MAYPTLEQYNEALQSPQLVLQDTELKQGRLKTSGLGLPLALCGGFALTYTVETQGKKFALRCFHKESRELERRYQAISIRIKQLASPYFLPFEFIPNGIRIHGKSYPIVKMAWAQGRTLAEFLESEHGKPQTLQRLRHALAGLAGFLERNQISHGDIQPENVMVNDDGSAVQLIDYDGMFVESFRGAAATELGQVNFQHPKRSARDFNEKLDRFSFITLDVALQALMAAPSLWNVSRSEPSAVVFRRNDFLDPAASAIFGEVCKLNGVAANVRNLARVVLGEFQAVPTLTEFLQGKGLGSNVIEFKPRAVSGNVIYQSAYPVCEATNYAQVFSLVGSRIELVGRIHSVRNGWGANKKPYIFVNFDDWRGKAVKLAIWFEGISSIKPNVPDESWVGRWLSVTGLVDPPYNGQAKKTSYTHLSITITAPGQIQQLPEQEAKFRLSGKGPSAVTGSSSSRNADILSSMSKTGGFVSQQASRVPSQPVAPKSSNQQLLEKMRAQTSQSTPSGRSVSPQPRPNHSTQPQSSSRPMKHSSRMGWGGWIFIGVVVISVLRACAR
ncbi:protein kinase family protein [Pseudomonas sp. 32A]|uniref:protein kinase family protein n=1 Tax=Pseudomonas sp. 32A TaxID=651185 RepID=UPI0040467008